MPPLPQVIDRRSSGRARADAWLVVAGVALAAAAAVTLELSERLYAFTRSFEHAQLDELPIVLFALSMGLAWYALRRRAEAAREAVARRLAENQLQAALTDLRRLASDRLASQEEERRHVARDLHDDLGQSLTALKLDATLLVGDCGAEPARARAAKVLQNVEHLQASVRDLISRLRPVALDELGLSAAIEHLATQWQERSPACDLLVTIHGDVDAVGPELALTIYRLVQEGLTNVFRHADASRVEVTMRRTRSAAGAEAIRVLVEDDGRGAAVVQPGFGLRGMRERVEAAGGTLQVGDAPPSGFVLDAELPIGSGP